MQPCFHGYSDLVTKECLPCPVGYVCIPGYIPRPCPLGQYVSKKVDPDGVDKIIFAGKEFDIKTKYICNDCPREFIEKFSAWKNSCPFLAGHKCGFAAAEPTPCPRDHFNTYWNQTTCQKCDIGTGQKCHKWSAKDNSIIIGLTHITDTLGMSFNSPIVNRNKRIRVIWGHFKIFRELEWKLQNVMIKISIGLLRGSAKSILVEQSVQKTVLTTHYVQVIYIH